MGPWATLSVAIAACGVASATPAAHKDLSRSPGDAAAAMLAKMSLLEKVILLHGNKSGYTGNTNEIVNVSSGVRIPPLNLNDGPQGFRTGGSTCWPSGMTVGATFDVKLASAWGIAMGKEFFDKGANVQLGPGLCLARVPTNGRNFEYLSGEDPYLGMQMATPLIQGIQANGVVANAKHWVENNQETNRHGDTSSVDERTRFEMYYPPFEGAIIGGVGSVMCSYNLIQPEGLNKTGNWSCENKETLAIDLKERLNFSGWVMSDWGATHSTSIIQGLDQEMPGGGHMGDTLISMVESGDLPESAVDESALRILTQMYANGLFENYDHWKNASNRARDVTSANHSLVAREIAAAATVLMKNDNSLLPIDTAKVKKIAVIGSNGGNGVTIHGGGSGQVGPTYVVTPVDGIISRYANKKPGPPPPPAPMQCGNIEQNVNYFIHPSSKVGGKTNTPDECCALCYNLSVASFYFTRTSEGTCWCHPSIGVKETKKGDISGSCRPDTPTPSNDSHVMYDDGSDPARAASLAASADIAIVFVGISSHEGSDRTNLSYPLDQESMISAVSKVAGHKTVVVMFTPGAVLTPWAANVAAVLTMFMPGLEVGHALASVLFGDVNPTGRLPMTFPNIENEMQFTTGQYPGINAISVYTEKLEVGYRWYDAHQVIPAFPFGHGLSYTDFKYSSLNIDTSDAGVVVVSFSVMNSGRVAGAEIPQLYLGFPETAGEPPQQLKGFVKTDLMAPGASLIVTFNLSNRDLSIWDVSTHWWKKQTGKFSIGVGASSRDIRLRGTFKQ